MYYMVSKSIASVFKDETERHFIRYFSLSESRTALSMSDTWPSTLPSSSGLSTRAAESRNNRHAFRMPPIENQTAVAAPMAAGTAMRVVKQ